MKFITLLNYFWKLSLLVLDSPFLTSLITTMIASVATLLAGFFGAWAGFKLQDRKKREDVDQANIIAGNRALLGLMKRGNFLQQFIWDYIDPSRGSGGRHVSMPAVLNKPPSYCMIDADLGFLTTVDEQRKLFELWLEGERFSQVIEVMNRRNDMHLNELQPAMRALKISTGSQVSQSHVVAAIGVERELELKNLTDSMVELFDQCLVSNAEMATSLHAALKSRYPSVPFLVFTTAPPAEDGEV